MTHLIDPRTLGSRILIVDDEPANVLLLKKMLSKVGYSDLAATTDPMSVGSLIHEGWPDLVLLDLNMPDMDGFEVMEYLQDVNTTGTYLPILVLTADATAATKERALAGGAMDFLTKPFDRTEVLLRIRNLLQTRQLNVRLEHANAFLEQRVRERTAELEVAQRETVDRLALTAEYRDEDTGHHVRRVGELSRAIALHLGLDEGTAGMIGLAAPLHDLGKIGVPDAVLLKPGPLDDAEFEIIRRHTELGYELLRDSTSPLLQMAAVMARHHHDRWDGEGYGSTSGEDIPIVARIVSVADVFDALTHARCYKAPWTTAEAVAEIRSAAGSQFDPRVVEAFLAVYDQVDLTIVV